MSSVESVPLSRGKTSDFVTSTVEAVSTSAVGDSKTPDDVAEGTSSSGLICRCVLLSESVRGHPSCCQDAWRGWGDGDLQTIRTLDQSAILPICNADGCTRCKTSMLHQYYSPHA